MPEDVENGEEEVEEEEAEGPEGILEKGSDKMHPNRQEDEQDMEMEPVILAPPGYGSPDPVTQEGLMVPVEDSPVELAEDYGTNVTVSSQEAAENENKDAGVEADGDEDRPATSATRAEWDDYARSKGVNPDEYSSKDDLIEALS
jgi:hypothetical protein